MNYSTLFPEMVKSLPKFEEKDMCYHYQQKNNDNKNMKVYIPSGKKILLWFVKFNQMNYSIVLDYDPYKKRFDKCSFHYMAFKQELTSGCGTLIACIKVGRELCLNKFIYYRGEKYQKTLISQHCIDFKYLLENYVASMPLNDFVSLHIPYMSNSRNLLLEATSLPYTIHTIMGPTNHQTNVHEFCATFTMKVVDIKKGIYHLYIKNRQNDLVFYGSAMVNDLKTQYMCRDLFSKKYKNYTDIELSDDDDEDEDENGNETDNSLTRTQCLMQCIYLPCKKKWKPQRRSTRRMDFVSKIKFIENKKYDVLR